MTYFASMSQPERVGLEKREREKRAFFDLAEQLAQSSSSSERKRLKEELAEMTFEGAESASGASRPSLCPSRGSKL
jgi:hypothetical protein